jgi:hypothetical protein
MSRWQSATYHARSRSPQKGTRYLTMNETLMPLLSGWDNFYVIVGSSGAALIGLQFVVIALIKDTRARSTSGTVSAFGTPTVVHLGGALVVSAIMSAPWGSLAGPSMALGICGLVGVLYSIRTTRAATRQTGYTPVLEDWLWHMILPGLAYLALAIAGVLLRADTHRALFAIAGAALGLLLVAIHNAWDTVTYIVLNAERDTRQE